MVKEKGLREEIADKIHSFLDRFEYAKFNGIFLLDFTVIYIIFLFLSNFAKLTNKQINNLRLTIFRILWDNNFLHLSFRQSKINGHNVSE